MCVCVCSVHKHNKEKDLFHTIFYYMNKDGMTRLKGGGRNEGREKDVRERQKT